MGRKKKKNKSFYKFRPDLQRSVSIVFLWVLSISSFLSFWGLAGNIGKFINHYYSIVFGWAKYIVAILLFLWGFYYFIWSRKRKRLKHLLFLHYLGAFLLIFNGAGLASFWTWIHLDSKDLSNLITAIADYKGGGYLGFISMALLAQNIGDILTFIFLFSFFIVGILFTFQISLAELIKKTYVLDYLFKFLLFVLDSIILGFKVSINFLISLFKKEKKDGEYFEDVEKLEEGNIDDIVLEKVELDESENNIETIDEAEIGNSDESSNVEDKENENEIATIPVFEAGDENKILEKEKKNLLLSEDQEVDLESVFPYQTESIKNYNLKLSTALLERSGTKPKSGDIKFRAQQIKKTLKNFGIDVEMKDVKVGPVVTQFSFKPADGIKLSRITALHDDLALALAAHPIRIEAPIPGKPYVGLEVPNEQSAMVRMKELIDSPEFKNRKNNMQIILGKDVAGERWLADLTKMPHLLVAGQTGSGKSVCLNAIIVSLLYQNQPKDLRFIMVDPKRVELTLYNGIPHLLTPVITDINKTLNALKWTVAEMERRYDILSQAGKRNIESYNETAQEKMPYIVFLIDELADIMVTAGREVETYIVRLTQMARAVGIHLVIATQRPSVNVITGLIKANIPARIAFSVASVTDSRTIIDKAGAEKLIGKGDMLFVDPKDDKARRIQGVYVSDQEVKKIVNALKGKLELPVDYYDNVVNNENGEQSASGTMAGSFTSSDANDEDPLYKQAVALVLEHKKASASYLQRRLRIGFTRAARLIDMMEENGVVGPAQGAKPREILIDSNSSDIINKE